MLIDKELKSAMQQESNIVIKIKELNGKSHQRYRKVIYRRENISELLQNFQTLEIKKSFPLLDLRKK